MAYGTTTGLSDYATDTGQVIPPEVNLTQALDRGSIYIDSYWRHFIGSPVSYDAAWPRTGVTNISDTEVPLRVIQAAYEAAIIWANDPAALALGASSTSSSRVKRVKVDVIETEYADVDSRYTTGDIAFDAMPRFSIIEALLRPFLKSGATRWYAAVV